MRSLPPFHLLAGICAAVKHQTRPDQREMDSSSYWIFGPTEITKHILSRVLKKMLAKVVGGKASEKE